MESQSAAGEKQPLLSKTQDHSKTEPIQPETRNIKRELVGYIAALVTSSMFVVNTVSVQLLGGYIPNFELNVWRYIAQMVLVVPLLSAQKCKMNIHTKTEALLAVIIGLQSSLHSYCFFTALENLPASTTNALFDGGRTVILYMVAVIMARKCDAKTILGLVSVMLCVGGIILAVQPEFIFPVGNSTAPIQYIPPCMSMSDQDRQNYSVEVGMTIIYDLRSNNETASPNDPLEEYTNVANPTIGYITIAIFVASSCFSSVALNKFISNVSYYAMGLSGGVCGIVANGILMAIFEAGQMRLPGTAICWVYLTLCSLSLFLASMSITLANQRIAPYIVSIISNIRLPILVAMQYTFLSHINPGHENIWEVIGILLIFLANLAGPLFNFINVMRARHKMNTGPAKKH